MQDNIIYVIGHKNPDTDSICSAISYAEFLKNKCKNEEVVAARCGPINPETEYVLSKFGVEPPQKIESAENLKIFLVDHNQRCQAIDNIEDGELVGVIDHHRIGDIQTSGPIYFLSKPVGSTATIIAEKYFDCGIDLNKKIAGLLLSSILSDTILHRSPTNTCKDEEIAEKLAVIADVDPQSYGKKMLKQKSKIAEKKPREIILGDFKEYEFGDEKIGIGQVETVNPKATFDRKKEIVEEMEGLLDERGYSLLILMVTDILRENTQAIYIGNKKELFEELFDVKVKNDVAFLKDMLSRKRQMVPPLEDALSK